MSHASEAKAISAETASLMRANIDRMNALAGFDVVIVCCGNDNQAAYWKQRLDKGKGSVVHAETMVLAVAEDWPGGAGNALGTLYAWQKAVVSAKETYGADLAELLLAGRAVGLYHTAGKGTRLAPLPAAENNNKPGVKIPAPVTLGGAAVPVTILEAVIKQTGAYAASRKGRLSVFWGDQVFVPSKTCTAEAAFHADILCSLGPMPSEQEWRAQGMDKYGLIAVSGAGAAQVEKVDHATAVELLSGLGAIESVGASLGSFSVSHPLLGALLLEFAAELAARKGKLDSDPHLWMPMTLERPAYLRLMAQKGTAEAEAGQHFDRIAAMVRAFKADPASKTLALFGPVDVGADVLWWDYGQLPLYLRNVLRLTEDNAEASLMKLFYGIKAAVSEAGVDAASSVSGCTVTTSDEEVKRSVLCNVRCNSVHATDAILINVTARRIVAPRGSIVYNVVDTSAEGIVLGEDDVRVGVFSAAAPLLLVNSSSAIDGGKAWSERVRGNALSFEEVYLANADADPTALEEAMRSAHDQAWTEIAKTKKRLSAEMEHN